MFYWVVKAILTPILRTLFRPWVAGAEHVPSAGGAILASNHLSFSDSIFLPLMVPRKVTFLAKSDYFSGKGVKGFLTKGFFSRMGQVPIDRSGGAASEAALHTGKQILSEGELFGIYPEGTRSPDGRLYRGHTGVARLALQQGAPVLPVAMVGTREAQPIGQAMPNLFRPITIRIGKPLTFERERERADDPMVLRQVTDEVMFELRNLSGQEYVNQYAKRRDPEALPAPEPTPVLSGPPVAEQPDGGIVVEPAAAVS